MDYTKRVISPGAEEELGREYKILDHGFLKLVDYFGNDDSIVQAARTSIGKGTTTPKRDRELIKFMMRHGHTSPFEMVEFKWSAKMPIFVARQWVRHRTANINEMSGRYMERMPNEFYIPELDAIMEQSITNIQGSSETPVSPKLAKKVRDYLISNSEQAHRKHSQFRDKNVAKELARIGLPLNLYTQWYWKNDLRNTFHFINLRWSKDAQREIRPYAETMAKIIKKAVPVAYEAFENYVLNAITLSTLEQKVVQDVLKGGNINDAAEKHLETRGEIREFLDKWKKLSKE